jgi:hypothetical protein
MTGASPDIRPTRFYESIPRVARLFAATLQPTSQSVASFWRFERADLLCFAAMFGSTLGFWLAVFFSGDFSSILCYWDGPNYIYAAITLYHIPDDNPWTELFGYDPSYFACHFPGFPLVIRFFAFLSLGNYYCGVLLAFVFSGLFLTYSFRRLLIAYHCCSDPTFTTLLLSVFPMRLVIYHSVGASEPLFIALVCLALTLYKFGHQHSLLLAIWLASITRIEGMALGPTFALCYLLSGKLVECSKMGVAFLAPVAMLLMHKALFDNPLAYLEFNSGHQGLIGWPPFPDISGIAASDQKVLRLHSFLDFYGLYVIGIAIVLTKAGPIGLFALIHIAYVGLIRHLDVYRYALPAGVFAVLIGFDSIWGHPWGRTALLCIFPLYAIELVVYVVGQLRSNRCSDEFLQKVMEGARDRLH